MILVTLLSVSVVLEIGLRIFWRLIPLGVCASSPIIGNYYCQPYIVYDKPMELAYHYAPGFKTEGYWDPANPQSAKAHYEVAIDSYRSRCQQGYGASCYRYAEFFAKGWGTDTNEFQARRLMEKSCAFGHTPACEYDAGVR